MYDNEEMDPFKLLFEIENCIAANTDPRKKEVGDYVKVWDGSALTDIEGRKLYCVNEPFRTGTFMVTETERPDVYKIIPNSDYTMLQDLIITDVNTRICYKVSSECVKIVSGPKNI